MIEQKSKFDEMGVKMLAVGNGSPMFAKSFAGALGFPEDNIYLDSDSLVFKALNLERMSAWAAAKRFFFDGALLAFYSSIVKDYKESNMKGDGQQLGGVFVLSRRGNVLYKFADQEHEATEFADLDALMNACSKGVGDTS